MERRAAPAYHELNITTCNGHYLAASEHGDFAFALGGTVAEPATWALMVAGFGVAGALRRGRAVAA